MAAQQKSKISAKDRQFEKRIAKRVLEHRKVSRKDLERALDIRFAINRERDARAKQAAE